MPKKKPDPAAVAEILRRLEAARPTAGVELHYETSFQLLLATILSAQCTDVMVNRVTPALFARYPTPADLMKADRAEMEALIKPTGFYKTKAKNLIGCATALVASFDGSVPQTREALVTLPGVGRKTANVILGCVFGVPGIVVDTHVGRVSRRLKWTRALDPYQVEIELGRLIPEKEWTPVSQRLVLHGRYVCKARAPLCNACPLFDVCPAEAEKTRAHDLGLRPALQRQR